MSQISKGLFYRLRNKLRTQEYILYTCIFFCFISFLILNFFYPLFADDWIYSFVYGSDPPRRLSNVLQIIESQYNHYHIWGGRSVTHSIAQLMLLLKPWLHAIINALAYTAFVYLIYKFCICKRKVNPAVFIVIYIFIWFFQPAFGETLLWTTGSANYLWGTLIIFLFIYPYYKYFRDTDFKLKGSFIPVFFLIAGVLAGWTNENMSVAVFVMLFSICFYFRKRGILPKWAITGLVGFFIGCIFLLAAPGNYMRLETVNESTYSITVLGILKERLVLLLNLYIHHILPLSVIFASGIVFLLYQNRGVKTKDFKIMISSSFIFFVTAHIAFAAMMASPQFPPRALFGLISLIFLAIGIVYANIDMSHLYIKRLNYIGILFLVIVFSYYYYHRYEVLKYAHEAWTRRYDYIVNQKKVGNLNIELKERIIVHPKYYLYDLSEDPEAWYNRALSRYMGVDSIKIVKE